MLPQIAETVQVSRCAAAGVVVAVVAAAAAAGVVVVAVQMGRREAEGIVGVRSVASLPWPSRRSEVTGLALGRSSSAAP